MLYKPIIKVQMPFYKLVSVVTGFRSPFKLSIQLACYITYTMATRDLP